jgi:hypothetical protein
MMGNRLCGIGMQRSSQVSEHVCRVQVVLYIEYVRRLEGDIELDRELGTHLSLPKS